MLGEALRAVVAHAKNQRHAPGHPFGHKPRHLGPLGAGERNRLRGGGEYNEIRRTARNLVVDQTGQSREINRKIGFERRGQSHTHASEA